MAFTRREIKFLIGRVGLGHRAAFSALYDATSGKLFSVCYSVLKNRAEAEEVLQEVYLRIWQKAGRYRSDGYSPMTWLITIARNKAIDQLRARRDSIALDAIAEPIKPQRLSILTATMKQTSQNRSFTIRLLNLR